MEPGSNDISQGPKLSPDKRSEVSSDFTEGERKAIRLIITLALYVCPLLFLMIILLEGTISIVSQNRAPRWISIGLVPPEFLHEHLLALVGVPMAVICSLWVVTILRLKSGPIQFELLGLKFRGASGPVILWLLCFLAIILAIKMLW